MSTTRPSPASILRSITMSAATVVSQCRRVFPLGDKVDPRAELPARGQG